MSKRIPREFINELLTRCDIVELIDTRIPLKKKGSNYGACCPFHNEKTPSFTVSPSKQFYHCFGCNASGNAISFIMEYERLSFVEAIEELANHLGIPIPREEHAVVQTVSPDYYEVMKQAMRYYQQQLRVHPAAIEYLKARGLSGQIAKEFAIGYASASWDGLLKTIGQQESLLKTGLVIKKAEGGFYDRFRDRVMFPIRDRRGRVIGFGGRVIGDVEPKYLNSPETPIFHKGSELYGLFEACQALRQLDHLIVVEGYMDVVALAQHDIRNAVATLGTATTADHISRLFRLTEEVVFCFDGDQAGLAAAWRALETTLPVLQDGWQVRFLFLPQNEDPDSFVRKHGKEEFNQQLAASQSLPDFFLSHLAAQVNLNNLEGKARLTKLAAPLLNKMSPGIYQHMLFEKLAQLIRLDIKTLKELMGVKTSIKKIKPVQEQSSRKRSSPMRLAISLLVQNPELIHHVDQNQIINFILPGSDLLSEVFNLLKYSPGLTTGMLLENWRERADYNLLIQLASSETNIPNVGIEEEFLGIMKNLQKLNHDAKIEQLLQKANLGQLSDEEKLILQSLITASKN